jgi:NADH-quinone oxidoreductase chain G
MKYFHINNKKYKLSVNIKNNSIIDYCENVGINIPHFCYHKKLSIAGNCRMCLVELKNSPKPLISCAMTMVNQMEIFTKSPLVKKARENVIEFLLLNHPLDCPVCDQGGECDLQDQAYSYGSQKKRFYNFKRIVSNKNFGILIKTVMTRCIHCTRCVRFSNEIAGTSELGVFSRGTLSEIGTYKPETFNSELSGNVIDICPVGALTSKQYPFVSRSWELKTVKSIDFTDSYGLDIFLYIKDNILFKVLSSSNRNLKTFENNWITDKTRFAFTGMFSPERITEVFLISNKSIIKRTWQHLFRELVLNIYFQDHLLKHSLKKFLITFIFSVEIHLEILLVLILLNKKYSFFKFKKLEPYKINCDNESNYMPSFNKQQVRDNICLLLNVNPRYESSSLNIKLRQQYLKGNFKILSLGSLINTTYPVQYIGSNISILKSLVSGNHLICQTLSKPKKIAIVLGSNSLRRADSYGIINALSSISRSILLSKLNILNSSLSETTVSFIGKPKVFTFKDFKTSSILYFLNIDFNSIPIDKFFELKLLNYYNSENISSKVLVHQNNVCTGKSYIDIKNSFSSYVLFNLPNKVFFEESGLLINNLGVLKNKIKSIKTLKSSSKSNWMLLRNFLQLLKKTYLTSNKHIFNNLVYNLTTVKLSVNYLSLSILPVNYYLTSNVTLLGFNTPENFKVYLEKKMKPKKKKEFKSRSYLWLDDFYIGNKDIYSKFSNVMIKCSKNFRKISTNFLI